jgi:coenzyme PQQ synthesis protein D (PqqD)
MNGEDASYGRAANVVAADIGAETVVLNIGNGNFYQLNATAARVWTLLESPATLSMLCTRLVERYDVTPEACRRDVSEVIEQMRAGGIVERLTLPA